MAAKCGGCYVTVEVVIANQEDVDRFAEAVDELIEIAADYPWLDLAGPVETLGAVYRRLRLKDDPD